MNLAFWRKRQIVLESVRVPLNKSELADLIQVVDRVCGQVAFYLRRPLNPGELPDVLNGVLTNGFTSSPGDKIRCGTCGRTLEREELIFLSIAYPSPSLSYNWSTKGSPKSG